MISTNISVEFRLLTFCSLMRQNILVAEGLPDADFAIVLVLKYPFLHLPEHRAFFLPAVVVFGYIE